MIQKKFLFTVILLLFLSVLVFNSAAKQITILTGSPGGGWYARGAAIAGIFGQMGIEANAEVGGGIANIINLDQGKGEIGFTYASVPMMAINAEPPFERSIVSTRGLFALDPSWMHISVLKSSGIKSIEDLKGVRFSSQPVGQVTQKAFADVLKVHGLEENDLELVRGSQQFSYDAMKDRNIKGYAHLTQLPTGNISELAFTVGIDLLGITPEKFEELKAINPGYKYDPIPGGIYTGIDEDVPTIMIPLIAVCNEDMPDEDAYMIVKTLVENIDKIRRVHAALKNLTVEDFANVVGVPLHPGAEKYYREIGVLK